MRILRHKEAKWFRQKSHSSDGAATQTLGPSLLSRNQFLVHPLQMDQGLQTQMLIGARQQRNLLGVQRGVLETSCGEHLPALSRQPQEARRSRVGM